jgi:predicted secreted Zn-dependent protease
MLIAPREVLAAGVPSISIKTNHYVVGGTNVALIRYSMSVARPAVATNSFDAVTHWTVRAEYQIRPNGNSWMLQHPRVNLSVTLILPRWIPGLPVSPELIQTWNEFLANLTAHEAGHIQIAREAAEETLRRLESMPGYASGPETKRAAEALVSEVIEEFRVRERLYDRQTRHGRTQGAILRNPRPTGPSGKH